jgi:predicted AAA+ superfamily ATPase
MSQMYIRRNIHSAIKNHLKRKEYTIITGPRQSGKTSLLQALFRELKEEGRQASYITLEDTDVLTAINTHPEEVFSFSPRPEKSLEGKDVAESHFLFLDEVQHASDPSNFLKYLYDAYGTNLKIVATGSSAFYMDHKFNDSLSGRKRIFELKTLSFDEWLIFKDQLQIKDELMKIRRYDHYISAAPREILELFDDYLIFGGYPEIALESDNREKILLLKELRDSFLKKDMDEAGIGAPDKFRLFFSILAGQTGNLVNKNELATTVGVDNKTIDKYLQVLQKSFHIELVKPFYSNLRKELTKMSKVYFKDSGMRNIALNRFFDWRSREDQGALLENYVHRRLTEIHDRDAIRFWRTADDKEIDFVVTISEHEGFALEVKVTCRKTKQAIKSKFTDLYPGYPLEFISYDTVNDCRWVLKV